MAVIENQIETKLTSAFQPAFLDVENESHKHNVPPGSESHFRVTPNTKKPISNDSRESGPMVISLKSLEGEE